MEMKPMVVLPKQFVFKVLHFFAGELLHFCQLTWAVQAGEISRDVFLVSKGKVCQILRCC